MGVRVKDDKNTITEQEIADYKVIGFTNFAGGNGTAENPYRISDVSMFCEIENYNDAHFILVTNLDLSDVPRIDEFNGIFDGNGNTVTVGLSAENGLFNSVVEGSEVENLVVNIGANRTLPAEEYGAVAIRNEGKIENCHVKGSINVNKYQIGYRLFGGIAAYNMAPGSIEKCRDSISVNLNDIATNEAFWWGGIAGNSISGKITKCLIENDFNIAIRPTTSSYQTRIGSIAGVFGYSNISECAINTDVSIAHLSYTTNYCLAYGVFAGDEWYTYDHGLRLASELNGIASCYIPDNFSLSVNFEYYGSGGGFNSKSEIYTKDNIKNVKTMSSDKIAQWYESLVDDYKPIEIKPLDITSFKASGNTVGENVRLDAMITGGTGQYSVTFSYILNGIETVLSNDSLLTYDLFMPTEEGTYDFIVSVKDSNGYVVTRKIEGYLIAKIDGGEDDKNHDEGNHLFNEYIYRANHLTDTAEVEGSTMESGYINSDTPSEILIKELQKNGLNYTADAWRTVTRACDSASDASKIVDYAVEEKDIYEAIILNALESAAKYDVVDSINADVIKETNELLKIIKNDLKVNYSIDIYDSTQNSTLTKEMRVRTKELAEEYYDKKNISKAADWLGDFEEVMGYLDTAEDFCEELTSYVNIRYMNDSMKSVLREMKKNCPSNNKALASALDDCVDILNASDSEFAKQILEGGLKTVGTEAAKVGISKFWSKIVVAKIEKLCPRVVIIKAAYKTSKYLTNLVFNTDEITEKYYKMIAATELDSLIRNTYASLKNTYVKGKNVENAKAYLSTIDVMFNAIGSDCDSAYAYADSVDSANLIKICKFFGCNSNASSLKASIESIKRENNSENEMILTGWVNYLPEDYPEEYPHYTRLFEESNKRLKEYQIHCPVDVYVYDSKNKLVASVINNIPSSSGLSVMVDGDEKTLYLPEVEQYSISYIGNGTGVMDIEIAEFDKIGTVTRNVNFNNISLSAGVKYTSNENGKFAGDAEYHLADSKNQQQKADFDSYPQEKKEKHTITIEQGTIFNDETPLRVIEAYENQVLNISAYVPDDCELDKWKVTSGNIEIKDVSNVNTKIIVGSKDATITAVLKGNLPSESPKPTDVPDVTQTPKPTNKPDTTITPKPTTQPNATENPKPTDGTNATSSPLKGTVLQDSKNKVAYKVTAQGKTLAFYKVNNKKTTKVVIPATVTISGIKYKVTAISDNACSGCKKIKSVTIGKYVTTIENKAFFKCTWLKKITIPASVKKIGKKAFYGCKKLKTITIKTKKLKSKSVGTQAFKGIYKKAVVKVPKKQKKAYQKWLRKKGITKKMKIK